MSRTGSIKRSGSTWGFVLDVGRSNGRRQQVRKRGFRTRKDAQAALNDALAELQHGTFVRPRRITLEAYLDDWLASLVIAGRRPTTIAGYRQLIRVHVNPTLGHLELQQITAIDVDRFYAQLAAAGSPGGRGALSKSTIRKAHVLIGKALGDAERKGLLQRNVARLASPPSASSARAPEMKVWTPEQLRTFLDFVATDSHGSMLRLAALTGLRRAELCGLRWQDLDLDSARLVVRQAITTVDHEPSVGDVKSTRSRRVIDLDPATVNVLRAQRKHQLEERLLGGPDWVDSGARVLDARRPRLASRRDHAGVRSARGAIGSPPHSSARPAALARDASARRRHERPSDLRAPRPRVGRVHARRLRPRTPRPASRRRGRGRRAGRRVGGRAGQTQAKRRPLIRLR